MSYVHLKHTLSALALDVVAHPERVGIADALLAYARRAGDGRPVSLRALAEAASMPEPVLAAGLAATRLFAVGTGDISLEPPYRPSLAYLRRQAARTVVAVRLLRTSHRAGISTEIWRAAALFNAGLFFECHEFLEDVWRSTAGSDRAFYHGLVQAAAGCYHLEKGNPHGAQTLLGKAAAKLAPYGPAHLDVDVAAFLGALRDVLRRLAGGDASWGAQATALPTLDLVAAPRADPVRVCAAAAVSRGGAPRAP